MTEPMGGVVAEPAGPPTITGDGTPNEIASASSQVEAAVLPEATVAPPDSGEADIANANQPAAKAEPKAKAAGKAAAATDAKNPTAAKTAAAPKRGKRGSTRTKPDAAKEGDGAAPGSAAGSDGAGRRVKKRPSATAGQTEGADADIVIEDAPAGETEDADADMIIADSDGESEETIPKSAASRRKRAAGNDTAKKSPGGLTTALRNHTDLPLRQCSQVIQALRVIASKQVRSTGEFRLPGVCKLRKREIAERAAGEVKMFGKTVMCKARPAKQVFTARVLPTFKRAAGGDPGESEVLGTQDSGRRRKRATSDGTEIEPVQLEGAPEEGAQFTVVQPLNLNLSVKVGTTYSFKNFLDRCKGNVKKMHRLVEFTKDPEYLVKSEYVVV